MTDWQPVETAPIDTRVEVGGWSVLFDKAEWRTNSGVARESYRFLFWTRVRLAYYGKEYTHWRPLPPPPAASPSHPKEPVL